VAQIENSCGDLIGKSVASDVFQAREASDGILMSANGISMNTTSNIEGLLICHAAAPVCRYRSTMRK